MRTLARWGLVAVLPVVGACNDHPMTPPVQDPTRAVHTDLPASLSNKLDILFMVDNSSSMKDSQDLRRCG